MSKKKITLLDGATGTRLWELAAAAGYAREPVWTYNLSHPELVEQVAREYIAAGTTLLCTNTFVANGIEAAHCAGVSAGAAVAAGVRAAKAAAAGSDVKIALDIGPLPVLLEPFGSLTAAQAEAYYTEQIGSGMAVGADCIFLETFTGLDMLCAAVTAAGRYDVPLLCAMSFERGGRTLMGDRVEDIAARLTALGVSAMGLNCSFGPELAVPVIREFAAHTGLPLILKPNAADCAPADFAAALAPALELVEYVGACCGSGPAHIRALGRLLEQ